jgi:peptide/nickel transport system ATP-binding protein
MDRYPFELSGGMRQRVMIALAFSCEPELIIADEPTTALDVTVQLQVLRLLKHKARASGTSVLFISHDMAVVSQLCDRMYVMYAGSVIESGTTQTLIHHPVHPYSIGLLQCAPENGEPRDMLPAIPARCPTSASFQRVCFPRALFCRRGEMQRNAALNAQWRRRPAGCLLVSATGETPCLMYCWNWIAYVNFRA